MSCSCERTSGTAGGWASSNEIAACPGEFGVVALGSPAVCAPAPFATARVARASAARGIRRRTVKDLMRCEAEARQAVVLGLVVPGLGRGRPRRRGVLRAHRLLDGDLEVVAVRRSGGRGLEVDLLVEDELDQVL